MARSAAGFIAIDITGAGAPVALFRLPAEILIEPTEAVAGFAADDSSFGLPPAFLSGSHRCAAGLFNKEARSQRRLRSKSCR